ncbi:MAG: hypothetical protein ACYC4A_10340 [Desulfobulbia bacterium]
MLDKTPELLAIINEVHPHYATDQYLYFQVLTQSCDLELRGTGCKSRYITLAAVRSLNDIINRCVEEKIGEKIAIKDCHCCNETKKGVVVEFLKKLMNNQEKDYFFLQKSPEHNLKEHCCTLLHLSISIRAYQHYNVCLKAKTLELKDNYQSKIGWMVGNLYSRVGTEDYVPSAIPTEKEFTDFIDDLLKKYIIWIPKEKFKYFKQCAASSEDFDIINSLVKEKVLTSRQENISNILTIIKGAVVLSPEDEINLKNTISQHPVFNKIL